MTPPWRTRIADWLDALPRRLWSATGSCLVLPARPTLRVRSTDHARVLELGLQGGLKHRCPQGHVGSNPTPGTNTKAAYLQTSVWYPRVVYSAAELTQVRVRRPSGRYPDPVSAEIVVWTVLGLTALLLVGAVLAPWRRPSRDALDNEDVYRVLAGEDDDDDDADADADAER